MDPGPLIYYKNIPKNATKTMDTFLQNITFVIVGIKISTIIDTMCTKFLELFLTYEHAKYLSIKHKQ